MITRVMPISYSHQSQGPSPVAAILGIILILAIIILNNHPARLMWMVSLDLDYSVTFGPY